MKAIHKLCEDYKKHLGSIKQESIYYLLSDYELRRKKLEIVVALLDAKTPAAVKKILLNTDNQLSDKAKILQQNRSSWTWTILAGLFTSITFPISVPLLIVWSWTMRGDSDFLKTDGSILVDKILSLIKRRTEERIDITPDSKTALLGENNMYNQYGSNEEGTATSSWPSNFYELSVNSLKMVRKAALSTHAFFSIKVNAGTIENIVPSKEEKEEYLKLAEDYSDFVSKTVDDTAIILKVLHEKSVVIDSFDNYLTKELRAQKNIICLKLTEKITNDPENFRRDELFRDFKKLMAERPSILEINRDALKNKTDLNLEMNMMREAHEKCEEHHIKFLVIAEELLNERNIEAREAFYIFEKFQQEINDKKLLSMRSK